jgi:hypothetical protein
LPWNNITNIMTSSTKLIFKWQSRWHRGHMRCPRLLFYLVRFYAFFMKVLLCIFWACWYNLIFYDIFSFRSRINKEIGAFRLWKWYVYIRTAVLKLLTCFIPSTSWTHLVFLGNFWKWPHIFGINIKVRST